MKKIPFIVICSLTTLAIGLSTWSLVKTYQPMPTEYTMYIGTNDKDTYEIVMPIPDARAVVHNTMMDHFSDGFTMYEANGVWRDEHNVVTLEYTFVCVLESVKKKEVYKAADELLVKLNQSTILVVENAAHSVNFYQGK